MWPRKIATAKPHERPSAFDAWWFSAKGITVPEFPMGTELLKVVCEHDPVKFELVNEHLERAFEAGRKSNETS